MVPLDESMVKDAVTIDEHQVTSRAGGDCTVRDHRLAKPAILLPFVPDRMSEATAPALHGVGDRAVGAVVGDHDLEVHPRLVRETLQDELEDARALVNSDHDSDRGARDRGRGHPGHRTGQRSGMYPAFSGGTSSSACV